MPPRITSAVMPGLGSFDVVSARSTTAMRTAYAVAHLFEVRCRLRSVRHSSGQFEAANTPVDAPTRRCQLAPPAADRSTTRLRLPDLLQPRQALRLNAQHHHRLRLSQRCLEVSLDGNSGTCKCSYFRQQLFGVA